MSAKVRPEVQATIGRYRDACLTTEIAARDFTAASEELQAMVAKGMTLTELAAVMEAYKEIESSMPRLAALRAS